MELQKVLELRQSIRRYKDGDIPDRDIKKIVDAARIAPSGKNIQNWHFVAIKDQQLKNKIGDAIVSANEKIVAGMREVDEEKALRFSKFCRNFTLFFLKAPVLFVVYSTVYKPSGYREIELYDPESPRLSYLVEHLNPGMQSLGAALENFTLKAIDLGYGSCWLTSANYASEEIEALLREEIGFDKEGYFMAALMSVGIPEDNQKSPKKKDLDEILTIV